MIYVYRNGEIVPKTGKNSVPVYRFKDYESPVTGASITSPRQKERDLERSGSYDPRDTPQEFRRAKQQRDAANAGLTGPRQLDFWR